MSMLKTISKIYCKTANNIYKEVNNRKLLNRKLPSIIKIYDKCQIYDSGYF